MTGPPPALLCLQVKVRKAVVRQPRVKQPTTAVVTPQELQQTQEGDKQETDRHMENMWRVLRHLRPGQQVPLTHLVCNLRSFAQTVENIFTLSFLVSQ